jgi:hypothetical protein
VLGALLVGRGLGRVHLHDLAVPQHRS